MTLVMDGVRGGGVVRARTRTVAPVRPERAERTQPTVAAAANGGLDGVRRQAAPVVRQPVVRQPVAPKPVAATVVSAPAPAPVMAAPRPQRQARPQPERQLWKTRRFNWKRPLMATAFAATTLAVSGLAVHVVATPRSTTANAETVATASPAPTGPAAPKGQLQPLLNSFVAANGSNFGIVVKDLKTGETASYQGDKQMESASLYKMFVAQRIYQRVDLGQLKFTQPAGGGSGDNIAQCLTVMINISDNTCGRALGDILGWGAQDEALEAEGYANTDLATPQQTSAADVGRLLERLNAGTLLSADSTSRFMNLLKQQKINNRLPVGLPAGTVIAHKTGDLDGFVHDAGIVYGPKTDYLVVVLSGPWTAPGNAPGKFAALSGQLWNYFEQ